MFREFYTVKIVYKHVSMTCSQSVTGWESNWAPQNKSRNCYHFRWLDYTIHSIFSSPKCPDLHWGPWSLLFNRNQCSFLGVNLQGCQVNQTPPFSAGVKNELSYTSSPPIYLHGVAMDNVVNKILILELWDKKKCTPEVCLLWIKRDQLDVTCFIISLFNAQHVSDVLTSETCWALNNEIIKQVTSSWSLFIQLSTWCTVQ